VKVVENIQKFNIEIHESDRHLIFTNVTPTTPPAASTTTQQELAERIYRMSQLSDGIASYLKN
jgi:hypothetical protein